MSSASLTHHVRKMTSAVAVIGNILSHYNKHLYVFLIPYICFHFFPAGSKITSLILGWATIPLGMMARPFGGYFFGKVGDSKGRETALGIALFGISFCTLAMVFIPSYQTVGALSPMLLIFTRMGYNFFSAGSTSGSFVTVLSKSCSSTLGIWSGIHTSSSVVGILIACFSVNLLALFGSVETSWRLLYVLGLVAGLVGYYLKKAYKKPGSSSSQPQEARYSFAQLINSYKRPLLMVTAAAAYLRIMYEFSIGFLNGYIPIISNLPQKMVTSFDTAILLGNVFLLPIFGLIVDRWGAKRIMVIAIVGILLVSPVSLYLIPHAPLPAVLGMKMTLAFLSMLFAVPAAVWNFKISPKACRFSVIALGSAIGTQLAGTSNALCLYLYKITEIPMSPALFPIAFSVFFLLVLKRSVPESQLEAVNT